MKIKPGYISLCLIYIISISRPGFTETLENEGTRSGRALRTTCQLPRGRTGECRNIAFCPAALADLRSGVNVYKCQDNDPDPKVICCPTSPRISAKKCKEYTDVLKNSGGPYPLLPPGFLDEESTEVYCNPNLNPLISGGRAAQIGEFPHVVAIGYNVSNTPWRCGGTLISDQFVLTAAHCVNNPSAGRPVVVLIGDITLDKKSSNSRYLSEISNIIVHPGYKSPKTYNDVALIKLARKIQISRSQFPACLIQPEDDYLKGIGNKNFSAAGWGVLGSGEDQSDTLQVVNLGGYTRKSCDSFYEDVPAKELKFPSGISRTQICAGDKFGRKDTCKGDSGGPIWMNKKKRCVFYIVGITSFGPNQCGERAPGIYTNVASYLDWIEDNVWPERGG